MSAEPFAPADDPASVVEGICGLPHDPRSERARLLLADLESRSRGNRLMRDPAEATAFKRSRYRWVKKNSGRRTLSPAVRRRNIVYQTGTLYGEWAGRHALRGQNRYGRPLPRPARKIVKMEVWNRQRRVADAPSWSGSALKSRPRPVQRALKKQHSRYPYRRFAVARLRLAGGPGGSQSISAFNIGLSISAPGLGAALGPRSPEPDVLNYPGATTARVGVWRCSSSFDDFESTGGGNRQHRALRHLPRSGRSRRAGDREIAAHGHSNSRVQGELPEARGKKKLPRVLPASGIAKESAAAPARVLSPWI